MYSRLTVKEAYSGIAILAFFFFFKCCLVTTKTILYMYLYMQVAQNKLPGNMQTKKKIATL